MGHQNRVDGFRMINWRDFTMHVVRPLLSYGVRWFLGGIIVVALLLAVEGLYPLLAHNTLYAVLAKTPPTLPEETEWTWEVRPRRSDARLPNVLLLGDSISRNYFPVVSERLAGKANVYLFASSASIGDPRLLDQIKEFAALENISFSVVHFNNGMHGWAYSEEQYREAFPAFLHVVREITRPGGDLIWATITPTRTDMPGGATNARVDARNSIAYAIVAAEGIEIDDQHALMERHQDLHEDSIHFNTEGTTLQGDKAAIAICYALGKGE
jgi:hypothetical protein